MSNKHQKTKFITREILKSSIIGAFKKFDPRYMVKNPVMFVVELGFVLTFVRVFSEMTFLWVILEHITVLCVLSFLSLYFLLISQSR